MIQTMNLNVGRQDKAHLDESEPDQVANKMASKSLASSALANCPYSRCQKVLGTWKGLVNHCYMKHQWTVITRGSLDAAGGSRRNREKEVILDL